MVGSFELPMTSERIISFLTSIGLRVHYRALPDTTFVPGILIEAGELVVDREKLSHPGDLLHEAGHIVTMTPSQRASLNDDLQTGPGEEMAAIAWSYAACMHLELPVEVVFHPHGYKGWADSLADNFKAGHYLGVPLLQWYGMTRERDDGSGSAVYPRMNAWQRAEPIPE